MTFSFWFVLMAVFAAPSEEILLIPQPRSLALEEDAFRFDRTCEIVVGLSDRTDESSRRAAIQLVDEIEIASGRRPLLTADDIEVAQVVLGTEESLGYFLEWYGLAGQVGGLEPQGYLVKVEKNRILVAGADKAGVFYGAQTVRQMIRSHRKAGRIPAMLLVDEPAFQVRGLAIESTGPEPTPELVEDLIDLLSEFKMNALIVSLSDSETMKALAALGEQYHVKVGTNEEERSAILLPDRSQTRLKIEEAAKAEGEMLILAFSNPQKRRLLKSCFEGLLLGAAAAWSGSELDVQRFDRALAPIFFGMDGNEAVEALRTLEGVEGFEDNLFDLPESMVPGRMEPRLEQATSVLAQAGRAGELLENARSRARYHRDYLEPIGLALCRAEYAALRYTGTVEAASLYAKGRFSDSLDALTRVVEAWDEWWQRFESSWRSHYLVREFTDFSLQAERVSSGYEKKLAAVRKALNEAVDPWPLGLGLCEMGRRISPVGAVINEPPDVPWALLDYELRVYVAVDFSAAAQGHGPVPVEFPVPDALIPLLAPASASAFFVPVDGGADASRMAQLTRSPEEGTTVRFDAQAPSEAGFLYLNGPELERRFKIREQRGGAFEVDNGAMNLKIDPAGGLIVRWMVHEPRVQVVQNVGAVERGFLNTRGGDCTLRLVGKGPLFARFKISNDRTGVHSIVEIPYRKPWVEVFIDPGVESFRNHISPHALAAGRFLFSDGFSGEKEDGEHRLFVHRDGVNFSTRKIKGGLALALLTPEAACRHTVGFGAEHAEIGCSADPLAAHFVLGVLKEHEAPSLTAYLDLRRQGRVAVGEAQKR